MADQDPKKFRGKYRIPSTRAQWWDYRRNAPYFITICTSKPYHHYFGKIENGKMILSPAGTIADILWHEIPHHHPHVKLGEFVVMPNHIHGILIMDRPDGADGGDGGDGAGDTPVQTRHALSLRAKSPGALRFRNPGKNSIPTIIGAYKSAVTKHANRLGLPNGWQTRFHDHIIRDESEHERIANYIRNNPANWDKDKFYK